METQSKPRMDVIHKGEIFKVLKVTGNANAQMPLHYSTKEVVLYVEKGKALLTIGSAIIKLESGSTQIIPQGQAHTLLIKENFSALVITSIESEIKFTHLN